MTSEIEKNAYILFLQFTTSPNDVYFKLAAVFKDLGVTLVPVKPQELDYFVGKGNTPVIMVTSNLAEQKVLKLIKSRYLDFLVGSNKIRLFHLNTFKSISSYNQFKGRGRYVELKLPLTSTQVVARVLKDYLKDEADLERWPGGRRAKLPQVGDKNE